MSRKPLCGQAAHDDASVAIALGDVSSIVRGHRPAWGHSTRPRRTRHNMKSSWAWSTQNREAATGEANGW